MDNIQIKKHGNRRSVQSLIEESAIDHSFNYQAQQMRRAFNVTIRDLNTKIRDQQRQIQKLQLLLNQKDQILQQQAYKNSQLNQQLKTLENQQISLKSLNTQLKKRLKHVQYRLQTMQDNKKIVPMTQKSQQSQQQGNKKNIKNQTYKQIQNILSKKIKNFTDQIRNFSMSNQLQNSIQIFLQELLYLNPQTARTFQDIFNLKRKNIEKITYTPDKLSNHQQWTRLQKSLEKLKKIKNKEDNEKYQYKDNEQSQHKNIMIQYKECTPQKVKNNRKIFVNYV